MTTSIQFTSKKEGHSETFDSLQSQDTAVLSKFRKNVFTSLSSDLLGPEKICQKVVQWALDNDVNHYSFLSFPYSSAACEKQQSLLDLKYIYSNGIIGQPRIYLNPQLFIKGEADGSSFPSGGLRHTHRARAYNIWDQPSEIFLRKKSKVAYIPSLLLTHSGQALDDMTIFRKSEAVMKESASKMLTALGIPHKDVFLALGLEQEFFVVPKKAYLQRQDLRFVGRCLFGRVGAKSQQFSDHYYAKIPLKIEQILKEVQNELLEIGIPFKTKHNQVGNNQFQFCAIYQQAGKAIFHNLVTMEILKEIFDSHGYTVLLHEKPFTALNGSGKHANWSINYVSEQNEIKNMFSVPSGNDHELFKLFVLITLSALKRNNALYFGAIAPPGNEIRLGGHQAPPRIISAYLGQTVSALIDGKERPQKKNLKEAVFSLPFDVHQEDTDRNRTSPYAYTGHKFEFRALGASQNGGFPMAVIAATLTKEFKLVTEKLGKSVPISEIINELHEYTQSVRFEDDGYSEEWAIEAKQRGLYVNTEFIEILQKMSEECKVFVQVGACNSAQIQARCEVMRKNYKLTVQTQAKTLLDIASQSIIPRSFAYLNTISLNSARSSIMKYSQKFCEAFDSSLLALEVLEESLNSCDSLKKASQLRKMITKCGDSISKLCSLLQKSESLPDLEDFLLL